MRIISIDPGYERLGVAVIEKKKGGKETLIFSTCIQTSKELPHAKRLDKAGTELLEIIANYKPQALAIETLFFSKNQKTALLVAEARGMILFIGAHAKLSIHEYSPADVKIAVTGHGKSDKAQIIAMIPRLIAISKPIKYDDEYDAIAVGLTYFAIEKPTLST